jgi:nicotinate-nucleotide adenylyltransferase
MKWGLMGGTFDPIHIGHLRCAEEILEIFNLNRVVFVPASRPPHKLEGSITSFHHREQMIKLAIEGNPNLSYSDIEKQRGGVSYAVETVEYFLDKYLSKLELFFILGQDAFHAIQTWKDWRNLLLLCHFVVMTRPGYDSRRLDSVLPADFSSRFEYDEATRGYRGPTGHNIFFQPVTYLDISASDIRKRAAQNRSVRYILPEAVRHYLIKHEIYGNPASP